MADKVLYEPTVRELLDAIEEAKKEGRKEIRIKGTYRDGTTPPIPSPHVIPWDFDPSRLRSSLGDSFRIDRKGLLDDLTKITAEMKDRFPLDLTGHDGKPLWGTTPPKDSHGWDIQLGDTVCVHLIGGNVAVYEVANISKEGLIIPLEGSFYIIKEGIAEAHSEEYYMCGVGARQCTVLEGAYSTAVCDLLSGDEMEILKIYREQGV